MGEKQLREELLRLLSEEAAHGVNPRPSDVMEAARQRWKVDEFAVREAIWSLLATHLIELTSDRTLRLITQSQYKQPA